MKLKCLIVDDERLAQNVLQKYIGSLPSLNLSGKCSTALEAISFIHQNQVDLIFLDINMPEMSGLEMLATIENPPLIILTTAYSEYALESYNYSVVDYLLKPISLERFLKAVNRAIHIWEHNKERLFKSAGNTSITHLMYKHEGILTKIMFDQILYIEAIGNYINLVTLKKKYTMREKLGGIEKKLPSNQFIRIHKSFIVSKGKINRVEGNRVIIHESKLPIGNYYKSEFFKSFNK